MTRARIVGFSGNITRPSKTLAFVDHIVQEIGRRNGLPARSWDIEDLGPSLVSARRATALDEPAQAVLQAITEADVLVIGRRPTRAATPVCSSTSSTCLIHRHCAASRCS